MMRRLIILLVLLFSAVVVFGQEDTLPAEDLADPDGQFIEIDDQTIYYIQRGPEAGPSVILVHGFGGSTFTWRENMDALAEAGYHVIAYDRPPYGLSEKSLDIDTTNAGMARQLAALMDALEIESAALVGHSAGGTVIAQFATTYPDRVDALVYVAGAVGYGRSTFDTPTGDFSTTLDNLDAESRLARGVVRRFLTPERLTNLLTSAYYDPTTVTDAVREGYQRVLRVEDWEIGFLALFAGGNPTEALNRDDLAALDVPVAIIWGEDDTWVPLSVGRDLSALHTDATLIIYSQTGHLPMEEQPEQFNNDLIAFLSDHL